ncbi:MAG: Dimethyl sulfoxide reductase anchor subunit [Acidobacteriota bacterium]|nr:Dimethyl sulfoxide reductase anchor subunit [Acidobacteriota bacterium]
MPLFSLSMSCNHCVSPACLKNCPAAAYDKDPGTGAVTIDASRCLGCKYCTWACPYDAPRYNAARGVIEKCDFCIERQEKGKTPACVCACPTKALRIGDYDETGETQTIAGFTKSGLRPAIRFKELRKHQQVPETTAPPAKESVARLFESSQHIPEPKIKLRAEWVLLLFTTLAALLVSWLTVMLPTPSAINPYIFLGAGALGLGLSSVHLGKKQRAFRAIFNIKSSWLSREILFFSLFLGLSAAYLLFFPGVPGFGRAAVAIGFISLFCIDRIYQVAMQVGPLNFHSAHTLLNGLYLTGALMGNGLIFGLMGGLKLFLYLYRKLYFKRTGRKIRPLVSFLRLSTGFLVPLILLAVNPGTLINYYGYIIISVIIGEVIDRTEYYDEIDIVTPRKQMLLDLETALP